MCAIAGILQRVRPIGTAQRAEMAFLLEAMHHRGPDARKLHSPAPWALFGANRLRITDCNNPAADMPLRSADGRCVVVFNGEIYNHRQLRTELADYPFATSSDTEVLLAAYQRWGRSCTERLEGMFALAIYDARAEEVFLACDPTGQKTVYFWEDQGELVFASEVDPLATNPHRSTSLDLAGLGEFVMQRFILGSGTHLQNVHKLESGTWLTWSPHKREAGRYYKVPIRYSRRDSKASLRAEVRAAVIKEAEAAFEVEVPEAVLSSGGIDSAAVLVGARRAGLRPRTFSIGFSATEDERRQSATVFDEFEHSRRLARELETLHTELVLSPREYCEALDEWLSFCGEPLGSQEAPCLLRLFEAAGAEARVVFSGSGPDELFDGYSYGHQLSSCSLEALPRKYAEAFHWAGSCDFQRLLPTSPARTLVADKLRAVLSLYCDEHLDASDAVQLLHVHGRLGVYEFRQLDLTSMRHSVEARSPLATRALVSAAFRCDAQLRHREGDEKWIYKQALRGVVPDYIARRKKAGFPIPPELWHSKPFVERSRILFDRSCHLTSSGLVDAEYLSELWQSSDPAIRNVFFRLYCAEIILRRQAPNYAQRAIV